MKRFLSFLTLLVLAVPAMAYAEWRLVRGDGPDAMFVSTAKPTVSIKASPALKPVAQGKMMVMIAQDGGLARFDSAMVWYSLNGREDAQLAVALAESDADMQWYPGVLGTDLEYLPILYQYGSDRYGTVTQRVFIRPVDQDPWMPAFTEKGMGWNAGVLVSQYVWLVNNDKDKLVVEYREPYPSEIQPVIIPEKLQAFVERANTAFSARFGENGDVKAEDVHPLPWGSSGASSQLLGDVLGVFTGSSS